MQLPNVGSKISKRNAHSKIDKSLIKNIQIDGEPPDPEHSNR